MKEKLKYGLISTLSVLCIATIAGGTIASVAFAEEQPNFLVSELFETTNVDIEVATSDPSEEINGLGALLSFNEGGSVKLKGEYSGAFLMEYLPVYGERSYTYKTMQIAFSEIETQETFILNVYNGNEFNASVTVEGSEAGIYYEDHQAVGLTRLMNSDNVYTQFARNSTIQVHFDPILMNVSITTGEEEYLVWSLKESKNDGKDINRKLNEFNKYTVELSFTDVNVNETGQAMLYKINNCRLDGIIVEQSGEPIISGTVKENALLGETYRVPKIYGFDVVDGQLDVTYELYDPNSTRIRIVNGAVIPESLGNYTLKASVENSFGLTTEKTFTFSVLEDIPTYETSFNATFENEYYVGETVYVPVCTVSGGLNTENYTTTARVTIYRNNVKLKAYVDVDSGFYYTLKGEGTYRFDYDVYGEKQSLEIQTEEKLVDFVCEVQDAVEKGTVLDFTDAKAYVNEEEKAYTFEVEYPNGYVYSNKRFVASMDGTYTVRIFVDYDGKTLVEEKQIQVYQSATDLFDGGINSDISYGTNTFNGKEGIRIHAKKGRAEVSYQKEIDISKYVGQTTQNMNGVTILSEEAMPFIELSVDLTKPTEKRAVTDYISVYLTDAEDPSNRIIVNLYAYSQLTTTYIRASAGEQGFSGFDNASEKKANVYLNNAYGKLWTNRYGFATGMSMRGKASSTLPTEKQSVKLYYDNEEKQILSIPQAYTNCIVTDFDDINYCNGNPWSGFASDKVILSVKYGSIDNENSQMGNLYYIHQIDGVEFKDPSLVYRKAPTINVFAPSQLYGLKGQVCTIPSAEAFDCYYNPISSLIKKVYYVDNGKYYDVSTQNGGFTAKYSGEYIVRFIAVDAFGNEGSVDVPMHVLDSASPLSAEVIDFDEEYARGKIYERVKILGDEYIQVSNEIGGYTILSNVYFQDAPNQPITIENGGIIPNSFGTYVVEYTITDAVGRACNVSYEIEIEQTEDYVVVGNKPIYYGFAYGNTYELVDMYIQDFSDTSAPVMKLDIFVNGAKLNGNTLKLEKRVEGETQAETVDSISIQYKYSNEVIQSFDVPVKTVLKEKTRQVGIHTVSQEQIKMERYFLFGANISVLPTTDSLVFTSAQSKEFIDFIQSIYSDGFEFAFDIAEDRTANLQEIDTNIKAVDVQLVDVLDSAKAVTLRFEADETGKVLLYVNGEYMSNGVQERFDGTVVNNFAFSYDNTAYTIRSGSGAKYGQISEYVDGEKFEGFGERVYVRFSITLQDESRPASLALLNINNHAFSELVSDSVNPTIKTLGDCTGFYTIGETIHTPLAKAYDVLSDVKDFYLTVEYTDLQGITSIASDVNGVQLNGVSPFESYEIQLDKLGTYRVIYIATDMYGNGSDAGRVFVVTVRANQQPVIELTSDMPKSLKRNQEVKIADYKVTYSVESEENATYVLYISPSNRYQLIKNSTFIPTEKGLYTIRYVAMDIYGNSRVLDYTIICE